MTLVIPPGFAQVSMLFSLTGDPELMISTFGLDMDSYGGGGPAAADVNATVLASIFLPASTSSQYSYRGCVLRIGQDGGPPAIAELLVNTPGTVAGDVLLPQNCALLVKKQTGLGGRRGRGRMYLPPFRLYEANVDSRGQISGTGPFQTDMNSLLAGLPMVLLHDDSPSVLAPTPITALTVDPRIATQRRRMRP